MKRIELRKYDNESSANVMANVLRLPKDPTKGTNYEEMLETVPILKKLEAARVPDVGVGSFLLEDSEWKILCERMKIATFGQNSAHALEIICSVVDAKEVAVAEITEE